MIDRAWERGDHVTTRLAILTLLIAMPTLTGCHDCCGRASSRVVQETTAPPQLASALLFDRYPGQYDPSSFAYRSDWPSTDSYYSGGEYIYYQSRLYDFQGRNTNPDWTYRRFDTYRSGVGYRP